MNIHARQEAIANIVREQTVHSQDELLAILRKRGFKVTQPTLSRDIRELGLAKSPAG
jgi:transcriptional regulator of arginine metabolism